MQNLIQDSIQQARTKYELHKFSGPGVETHYKVLSMGTGGAYVAGHGPDKVSADYQLLQLRATYAAVCQGLHAKTAYALVEWVLLYGEYADERDPLTTVVNMVNTILKARQTDPTKGILA